MDHKLLNLAEQAGMHYTGARFVFTYQELQEFYKLVEQETYTKAAHYEKANQNHKVL